MSKRNVLVVLFLVGLLSFPAVSHAADATNPYASDMQVVSLVVPEVAQMRFITETALVWCLSGRRHHGSW